MMLKIALCDDDKYMLEELSERINTLQKTKAHDFSCEISTFSDGAELAEAVNDGACFDIIFLDIEMDEMDGLVAAAEIRKVDKSVVIIYVTSFSEYAIEAYAVQPFRFLVKPIDSKLFEQYFFAAVDEIKSDDSNFHCRNKKETFRVPISEIIYFHSKAKTIEVLCTGDATYLHRGKMREVEKTLDQTNAEFWRIHQSYLVNFRHVYKVRYKDIEMSNGMVLPISERYRSEVRQKNLEKIKDMSD